MTEARVSFDGGPMDGITLTGLFARAIVDNDPPFTCMGLDEGYEHYIKITDCECGVIPCYAYAGPCPDIDPHPDCGHDHTGDD